MTPSLFRGTLAVLLLPMTISIVGCTHTIKVEPIKVEPIDISLHIYLEADEKLDEFFSDVEAPAGATTKGHSAGTGSEGEKP